MKPLVICLFGPTAIGKSQLAFEIAQQLPCELVSVDSAMIYRGMDIGTAKPSIEIRQQIPHHLIDICDPSEIYSAGSFYKDAVTAINDIFARQRIPLLVGGTMLYFHVLQQGLAKLPVADLNVREKIDKEAEKQGWLVMYARLQEIDPIAAKQIGPNDAQRIQRALEVYEISGKPISQFWKEQEESLPFKFLNIALLPEDRALLHEKIAQRFSTMLQQGLIDEVKSLFHRQDLHADLPSMRSVGYRQIWNFLSGKYDEKMMQEKTVIATRQLAKHQLTWIRSWENSQSFFYNDSELLKKTLDYISGALQRS